MLPLENFLVAQGERAIAQAVRKLLAAELPELRRVETQSLHRGVAGARHGFLEVPAGSNKLDMLRQVRCFPIKVICVTQHPRWLFEPKMLRQARCLALRMRDCV